MAIKFNNVSFKRGELLYFNPDDLVLRESGKNGRAKDVSQADVEKRAISILKYGQIEPIRINKDAEGNPVVDVGTTRVRAVKLINSGWEPPLSVTEWTAPELPLLVSCQMGKGSEETSLLLSIEENRERNNTNAIDDLHNQSRLRDELGYTDAQIADVYGCTEPWIQQLRKLENAAAEIRNAVADGTMAVAAAIELMELPKAEQKTVYKELEQEAEQRLSHVNGSAKGSSGVASKKKGSKKPVKAAKKKKPKITVADAKKKTRAARVASGKGGTNRSFKEIKAFLEGLTGPAEPKVLKSIAPVLIKFMQGKLSEDLAAASLRSKLKD